MDELIQGLEDLGRLRTTGEDQTICVLSDSFSNTGGADALEASGDLPPVDVVKVIHYRCTYFRMEATPTMPDQARC